ncbi:hypothetical protein CYLTODRAFT_439501 [Cylindrobasidium torrendii FP15055 ss-10]|uniref:BHLH domain-containing protein n=1 Tax=Cylindrobasidium torrendii FP15055 ss-10 TaxID=1314674 RepID=A0A0D7BTU7_9AGAR|nr:hypothetical protein CYLTODRAFT_439501 [Cylindrobasidium torrendii FP15055 ss-10]
MDFTSPSPPGSSSASSSGFDSTDLDLSSILHDDVLQDTSMLDWSQISSMWQDIPDLGTMDFEQSPISVDPSILNKPQTPAPVINTDAGFQYDFPFTFQQPQSPASSLSPSESLSDTASLSGRPSNSNSPLIKSDADLAAELAQRVLESAGIISALPLNGAPPPSTSGPSTSTSAPALPPATATFDPSEPGTQGAFQAAAAQSASAAASTMMMSSRPKTSHTTIERRYRTNLNARIQSLRMAVPALRVLEWSDGAKKSKGTKARLRPEGESEDLIDERGFVDGVRVARKCSKANVLGKAVEYISVLKKRENRLKREQDGLKALVGGLVGGPALLNAWETEWRVRFGGEEKDEVDGLEDEAGDSDDEDEEEERKRKKPKTTPAPPPPQTPVAPGTVPEKRKRGRPRKVPLPPTAVPDPVTTAPVPPPVIAQTSAPQYLLATFALFSFFNNPLTSPPSTTPHTHDGVVLGGKSHTTGSTYQSIIQAFHLLVSVLVFASILYPWISKYTSGLKPIFFRRVKPQIPAPRRTKTAMLSSALQTTNRGQIGEVEQLKDALACGGKGDTFEEKGLEQRAWVRLGEISVFSPDTTSLISRLWTIYNLRSHLPWFSASAGDLTTLAMLLSPIAPGRASSIWEAAKHTGLTQTRACAYERLVLSSVDVQEAAAIVTIADKHPRYTPIGVVSAHLILRRLRKHAVAMFVGSIVPRHLGVDTDKEEEARRVTVDSARSLGGDIARLGDTFEEVWNGGDPRLEDEEYEDEGVQAEIRALLVAVVLYRQIFPSAVLGKAGEESVSILLSPPPSPTLSEHKSGYRLREILGQDVFEEMELEEARDRVVDLLVAAERSRRL